MRLALMLMLLSAIGWAAPSRSEVEAARRAYQRGIKHYNIGEYDEALRFFKDAYLAVSEPSLLFNIGQCQRQLGLKADAVRSYKNYLRESPEATNRADVEHTIAALEASLREDEARAHPVVQEKVAPPPAPVLVAAPAVTKPAPAPPEKTPVYKKWWLWTIVGVAAVGVGVGLGVGLSSTSVSYPNADTPGGRIRF